MSKTQVLKSPAASGKEITLTPARQSLDGLTAEYARDFATLAGVMSEMTTKIEAIKKHYLPSLRTYVVAAKQSHAALNDAIAANPAEFVKPRTLQLHGFKIGLRKQEGKMVFADEDKAVKLVQKLFPDICDVLLDTKYSIVKDAAGQLSAADLKRIGGEITDSVDEVVIKSATGDVEKLVDALIREKGEKAES